MSGLNGYLVSRIGTGEDDDAYRPDIAVSVYSAWYLGAEVLVATPDSVGTPLSWAQIKDACEARGITPSQAGFTQE